MHMHVHADLKLCWSEFSWASLYVSFIYFFYFLFYFFFYLFILFFLLGVCVGGVGVCVCGGGGGGVGWGGGKSPGRPIFHLCLSAARIQMKLYGCSLY